jgi:transcriptional regulator with XRE-family HTH domain
MGVALDERPSEHEADRRARTVVQVLMTTHEVDAPTMAEVLRLTRPAVTLKLRGQRRFTVAELFELAAYFGVDPQVFFEDPKELVSGRSRMSFSQSPSAESGWSPRRSGWSKHGNVLLLDRTQRIQVDDFYKVAS